MSGERIRVTPYVHPWSIYPDETEAQRLKRISDAWGDEGPAYSKDFALLISREDIDWLMHRAELSLYDEDWR